MPVNSFECSELFIGSDHATAHVEGERVTIVAAYQLDISHVVMQIDSLQTFIEKCRRIQEQGKSMAHDTDPPRDTRPDASQSSDNA